MDLFFRLADARPGESLVDVGGGIGIGGKFRRLYDSCGSMTIVNLRVALVSDCGAQGGLGGRG